MRFFTVLLIGLLICAGFALRSPETVTAFANVAEKQVDSVLNQKRIEVSGLRRLKEGDIKALLPLEASNPKWLTQSEIVRGALKSHPLIQEVEVSRCADSAWYDVRCFHLRVTEREPRFIAVLGEHPWLVGKDGVFMAPLDNSPHSAKVLSRVADALPKTVMVKGLVGDLNSPALVQGKLELLSNALDLIAEHSGRTIEKVVFEQQREFSAYFKDLPVQIRFEFDPVETAKLKTQAQRLRTVLADLQIAHAQIESIDLAFDKLAVVHLKNQAS